MDPARGGPPPGRSPTAALVAYPPPPGAPRPPAPPRLAVGTASRPAMWPCDTGTTTHTEALHPWAVAVRVMVRRPPSTSPHAMRPRAGHPVRVRTNGPRARAAGQPTHRRQAPRREPLTSAASVSEAGTRHGHQNPARREHHDQRRRGPDLFRFWNLARGAQLAPVWTSSPTSPEARPESARLCPGWTESGPGWTRTRRRRPPGIVPRPVPISSPKILPNNSLHVRCWCLLLHSHGRSHNFSYQKDDRTLIDRGRGSGEGGSLDVVGGCRDETHRGEDEPEAR